MTPVSIDGVHSTAPICRSWCDRTTRTATDDDRQDEVDDLLGGLDRPGRREPAQRRHDDAAPREGDQRGAGARPDEAREGQQDRHERERGTEPGDRDPRRARGAAGPSSTATGSTETSTASVRTQDQPGPAVRRGDDQRLERVLLRAVGGRDPEDRDERCDEEERRQQVVAGACRPRGWRRPARRRRRRARTYAATRSPRAATDVGSDSPHRRASRIGRAGAGSRRRRGPPPRRARAGRRRRSGVMAVRQSAHRARCCSTEAPSIASRPPST